MVILSKNDSHLLLAADRWSYVNVFSARLNKMRVPVRLFITVLAVGVLAPVCVLLSAKWHHHTTGSQGVTPFSADTQETDISSTDQPKSPRPKVTHTISPVWWRNHIQRSCKKLGLGANQNYTKPMLKHIIVDDNNKLMYCAIPKVASTTWRRIFIILSGRTEVNNPLSFKADDVHHKYSKHIRYLDTFSKEEIQKRLRDYYKFVFVREPFERLLSAFKNKFVTQTNSSRYFKSTFGKKIIKTYRVTPPANHEGDGVTFPEFVEYLVDPSKEIAMNEHWEKYETLCNPCLVNYDFIGKLESIETDGQYVLDKLALGFKIAMPRRSDLKYATEETQSFMKEYYSQLPRRLLLKLFKMYQGDFLLFNYTVPRDIMDMMGVRQVHI